MVLPAGFGLPPLPYVVALSLSVLGAGWLLYRQRPPVSQTDVLAVVPWMLVGAALHAVYQLEIAPPLVKPFLGTPAVYLTTFSLLGVVWGGASAVRPDRVPRILATVGAASFGAGLVWILAGADSLNVVLPVATVAVAGVLALACWAGLAGVDPDTTETTHLVGILVVFAHALDGVSTAVGADVLGYAERTPLAAAIMEFAGTLPTADAIGVGWLFVLVKLALVLVVLRLFVEYVREDPTQAYILLAVIAAVGIGPGTQNVLLYVAA